jgi:SAM-dependent methyltransferase
MSVFADYARYYDLLYKDKPYAQEVEYIARVLARHAPQAKTLLELGCGSGVHASHLAARGYGVHGIDQSEWMLKQAQDRKAGLPEAQAAKLAFHRGDVRSIRLDVKADAVISLFHVMSYQTENADVEAMFATASAHLAQGGVFFFDVWYGPAVLTDRPAIRVKELEDDALHIARTATPTIHANRNVVDVHYRLAARDKRSGAVSETEETHHMRYFFAPELAQFAAAAGFAVADSHTWLNEAPPGFDSWGVSFVCRKC